MTLENATQNLWKAHCNFYDPRKAMNIVIDQIFNDHEAIIKEKDEEIERLKTQMTGWSMMFDEPQDAKARSIVAMLFWEWHKLRAENGVCFSYDAYKAEERFKKAYKMLKDNQ